MDVSPTDRDLMVRTMLGEAADQPDIGKAAVGHVIMNRVATGRWGDTPGQVVKAKGQFEPWQTRAQELNAIDPESPRYKKMAGIADDVIAGRVPDYTFGATHFLQPEIVRKRRGGSLPDWASGPGIQIGGHTFFRPDNGGAASAINRKIGADRSAPTSALAYDESNDPFRAAGFDVPVAAKPAPAFSPRQPAQAIDLFEAAGFTPPGRAPAPPLAPAGALPAIPESEEHRRMGIEPRPMTPPPVDPPRAVPEWVENLGAERIYRDASNLPAAVASTAASAPGELASQTKGAFQAGTDLASSGISDLKSGLPFPYPSEQGWKPGGIAATGFGALGAVTSPLSAAINYGVVNPVTQMTGSPAIGERAGLVASAATPLLRPLLSPIKRALPAARARGSVADFVGEENLPEAERRLTENPRLTLMDVDPKARQLGQGLMIEPGPWQNRMNDFLNRRSGEEKGVVQGGFDAALGNVPDVKALLDGLKEEARVTGRTVIEPALRNARPVDLSGVISAIDAKVKPGVNALVSNDTRLPLSSINQRLLELKSELTDGDSLLTEPRRVHEIQSELRREADSLTKSASGAERLMGARIYEMREKLVDAIDRASDQGSGGTYRPALKKYAADMDVQDAFNKGLNIFRNRAGEAGLEDRPEYWRAWINDKDTSTLELRAAIQGARVAADQKLRSFKRATRAEDLPEVDFNREKLDALIGPKLTNKLQMLMRDTRGEAQTNVDLRGNSQTAQRLAGRDALKIRGVTPFGASAPLAMVASEYIGQALGYPGIGGLGVGALSAAHKAYQFAGRRSDVARNNALARLLTTQGQGALKGFEMPAPQGPPSLLRLSRLNPPISYFPGEVGDSRSK